MDQNGKCTACGSLEGFHMEGCVNSWRGKRGIVVFSDGKKEVVGELGQLIILSDSQVTFRRKGINDEWPNCVAYAPQEFFSHYPTYRARELLSAGSLSTERFVTIMVDLNEQLQLKEKSNA